MQLGEILSVQDPLSAAVVFEDKRFSYADLEGISNQFANLFASLGIAAGERVSLLLGNDPLTIAAYFGAFKSGVVASPLHDRLSALEIAYIIDHAGSELVITSEGFAETLAEAMSGLSKSPRVLCFGDPGSLDCLSVASLEEQPATLAAMARLSGDESAVLLYTSGTTGRPKGVLLSRDAVLTGCLDTRERFGLKPTDRTLCVLPLSHTNALTGSTIPALMAGASIALCRRFSASRFWSDCRKYGVNSASVSPTILTILLDTYSGESLDGIDLDYVKVASAPTSVDLARRFEARFGRGLLVESYGLTETTACVAGNPVDGPRKFGSIGMALQTHELKIVDEKGDDARRGEAGELVIRSPTVMKGYFRDPAATAAVMRDGWLLSGDLATMDEDGYIFIVGRKKEIIVRGGENVAPLEVEQVIARHPAVLEAIAVGIPDRVLGEAIGACVVRRGEVSESELIAFSAKQMASFKVPTRIVFIDTLPRNAIGKLIRTDLTRYFTTETDEAYP